MWLSSSDSSQPHLHRKECADHLPDRPGLFSALLSIIGGLHFPSSLFSGFHKGWVIGRHWWKTVGWQEERAREFLILCVECVLWLWLLLLHNSSCCQLAPFFVVSVSARNPPSVLLTSLWQSYLPGSSKEVNGFWLLFIFGLPKPSVLNSLVLVLPSHI